MTGGTHLGEPVGERDPRLHVADVAHALAKGIQLRSVLRALQFQLLEPLLQVHQLHLQRELLRLRARQRARRSVTPARGSAGAAFQITSGAAEVRRRGGGGLAATAGFRRRKHLLSIPKARLWRSADIAAPAVIAARQVVQHHVQRCSRPADDTPCEKSDASGIVTKHCSGGNAALWEAVETVTPQARPWPPLPSETLRLELVRNPDMRSQADRGIGSARSTAL